MKVEDVFPFDRDIRDIAICVSSSSNRNDRCRHVHVIQTSKVPAHRTESTVFWLLTAVIFLSWLLLILCHFSRTSMIHKERKPALYIAREELFHHPSRILGGRPHNCTESASGFLMSNTCLKKPEPSFNYYLFSICRWLGWPGVSRTPLILFSRAQG